MQSKREALPVVGVMCDQKPFYEPLAVGLLEDIRAFFQTPEGEKEFQAWLKDPVAVRRAWEQGRRPA